METNKVIFVDDEKHVRLARQQTLELAGYEVAVCSSGEKALSHVSRNWEGVLVTDIKMPSMDGMTLLKKVVEIDSDLPVIMVTGHGDVPMAVNAIHIGAYDFIEKPCPTDQFLDVIKRAMEKRSLVLENRGLRSEIASQKESSFNIIGKSAPIEKLKKIIQNVADSDADVLIYGETGTGKELTARCLHENSGRKNKSFVAVNCGAIPETIIESELFGHEEGAFTGANQRRIGKFEFASGGTIFLDEIESMPLLLQVKLLRVLQERVVERLGSNETIPVNLRVIAATKVDLKEASANNEFREDLYYRLNVVNIQLPSLRERKEDIPLLFQHFIMEASAKYNYQPAAPGRDLIQNLTSKTWEGNIRELKNEAERYVLGLNTDITEEGDLENSSKAGSDHPMSLVNQVSTFEKATITQELIRQNGDIKKTYTALGIPRQTLYDKMHKYNLKRSDYV